MTDLHDDMEYFIPISETAYNVEFVLAQWFDESCLWKERITYDCAGNPFQMFLYADKVRTVPVYKILPAAFQSCVVRCLYRAQSHAFMVVNVYNSNAGYFQSAFVFTGTTWPEIANPRRFAAWFWNEGRINGYRLATTFKVFPDDGFIEGKPVKVIIPLI